MKCPLDNNEVEDVVAAAVVAEAEVAVGIADPSVVDVVTVVAVDAEGTCLYFFCLGRKEARKNKAKKIPYKLMNTCLLCCLHHNHHHANGSAISVTFATTTMSNIQNQNSMDVTKKKEKRLEMLMKQNLKPIS